MALFGLAYNEVCMLMPVAALGGAFAPAYEVVRINEGGYANIPSDKGGETYAGIARNFNASWPGWPIIDAKKYRYANNIIPVNTKFPDLQFLVERFYLDRWNKHRFGEINSQAVANLLFDYHVHSQSTAIRAIQNILGISADGVMGTQTINAINKANEAELFNALKAQREAFLRSLAAKDSTQEKFLPGWLTRVSMFEDMSTPVGVFGLLLLAAGIGALFYFSESKPKRTLSAAA